MPLGRPHLLVILLAGSLMSGCARKHLTISPEQRPLASQHLQLAEEAVDEAEQLQLRGRYRRAEMLLERADVDAQLAALISRDRIEQQKAQAMRIRVANLKNDE